MDKFASFYPAFEIERRSTDSIFRELCQPADYKKLNEGGWKEALVNRYGEMMAASPNMRKLAARLINERLVAKGYAAIDAEHVYFNTFTDGYKKTGDSAYRHNPSQLKESYSLVDAAIFDIFNEDWYNSWNELANDRTNGIYSAGKEADEWGPSNKLPFSCQVIANILYYDVSIVNSYPYEFDTFWNKYTSSYRDFLADSFWASALIQYRNRLLSEDGFQLVRHFYYSDYVLGSKVIQLDVYGYYSPDILCIQAGTERILLYIPGANMPFREFVSIKEMKTWIAEQLRMPENRDAFARHFSLYDRTDGATFYGLDSVLRFIAEGNSNWDPQQFIIYKERPYDLSLDVFNVMCDLIKTRTMDDRNQKPALNTARYRDYVMEFSEFFLAQVQMPRMILPDIPCPLDMDASHTPLGLLSPLVIDSSKLSEPQNATGSRVDTDTFKALDLLRICTLIGNALASYSRPADKILSFASEQQAITARFGLTEDEQQALHVGDEPKQPLAGQPAQLRLVRLFNDSQPLSVICQYAGNQFKLLDTLTLAEVKGQLVSAVLDETTGKTIYSANGYFRGYLPFQPYRFAFEYLWTPAHFRDSLGTLEGTIPQVLSIVYDQLEHIHTSITLQQCQEAAFGLIEAVDMYINTGSDDLPYRDSLATVAMQVTKLLFPAGMELLRESLLTMLPVLGAQTASYVYEAGIEEMAGENEELTATLFRYARYDNLIPLRFAGFTSRLAETFPYPPRFVINNLADFNSISTHYYEQEPYRSLGLVDNKSVFRSALAATRQKGLLNSCFIYEERLYIGCAYEELVYTISEASCNPDSKYTTHPLIVLRMLQELSGNANDPCIGLIVKYAVTDYYRSVIDSRLHSIWEIYHLTENFDFSVWDKVYGESFRQEFEMKEGEMAEQALRRRVRLLLEGKGCALPANAAGIGFFLDHLQTFVDEGVTCVGITSFYKDIIQEDMDIYFSEDVMSYRLDAVLLTLDQGLVNGPFRRLLSAIRTGNMSLLVLGHADGSATEESNGYTHLYFRGATLLNALKQLPETGKTVFFTHQYMMFSTPGLNAPLPGLTQCLHIPGAWVDEDGALHYYAESPGQGVLTKIGEWKEVDGEILPIENNNIDSDNDLTYLMPEDGKLLGLERFGGPSYIFPTIESREALLKKTVNEEDWPTLKLDVDAIKEAMSSLVTDKVVTGSTVGVEVVHQLEILGYQPGRGATLVWLIRGKDDKFYSYYHHTAPTVLIKGNEYVVDVAHLQFLYAKDEGTIMLGIDDWSYEISSRAMALYPYVVYSMKSESELASFIPFPFIVPRLANDI